MKTEPSVFSFDDLVEAKDHTASWDGVRNYQARNFQRDEMRVADVALIYHSSVDEPAIVGIAEVVRGAHPDHSAMDPKSRYYDAKAKARGDNPWVMIDIRAKARLTTPLTRAALAQDPRLKTMAVLRRGNRLSIMPVSAAEFATITALAKPVPLGKAGTSPRT